MATRMRCLLRSLMIVTMVAGFFPALFMVTATTPTTVMAQASCTPLLEGFSSDVEHGAYNFDAYQCDSYAECTQWLQDTAAATPVVSSWLKLLCGVVNEPLPTPNPLGEIPSLDLPPSVQVVWIAPGGCYAESCDGLNPEGTRCAQDAYTIYSREVFITSDDSVGKGGGPFGIAEMRYSPICHANWVRYTPYSSLARSTISIIAQILQSLGNDGVSVINDTQGLGVNYGEPYIWREGVDHYPYGPIGSSSALAAAVTNWTSMVSADGRACWSVELFWREDHHAGAGDTYHLGTFDTDCVD